MRKTALLLAALMLAPAAATAGPVDAPLMCSAQTQGMLSCQVNTVCECRFEPAAPAKGQEAGYRWDCSILRPKCSVAPADAYDYYGWMPSAVGIDRSSNTIIQEQFVEPATLDPAPQQ